MRLAVLLATAAAALPASASAAAPWSAPQSPEGVAGASGVLTTARGDRVLVGVPPDSSLGSPTVLGTLGEDGAEMGRQRVAIAYSRATTSGDRIVVAGSRPGSQAPSAPRGPCPARAASGSPASPRAARPWRWSRPRCTTRARSRARCGSGAAGASGAR